MKNRAFTLIELLVVIAIIAILAAILFPVFAQAKLAAKKAASLSNTKEIGLANIIYENDFDDNFVLSSWDALDDECGAPGVTAGSGGCLNGLTKPTADWPNLLQPYIKSYAMFVDPGTGDPQGNFGGGTNSIYQHWNVFAQYGYNYQFLSPLDGGSIPLNGNDHAFVARGLGRSTTSAIAPANTVMFTTAQNFATPNSGAAQFQTPDVDMANPPGTMFYILPSSDRVIEVSSACFYTKIGPWACNWMKNSPLGELTSDVRALNPYNGANVVWVDGHAKAMTADALAVGTDFGTATTAENGTAYGSTGTIVTDLTKYLWSLDGTLTDVK